MGSIASSANFNSIFFIDLNTGWLVSDDGKIFTTTDGGANWTIQLTGAGALEELVFIDANIGWAINFDGLVQLTTDGGDNWASVQIIGSFQYRSISFFDANNGIACSNGGRIFRSTDGGNTWVQESSGTVETLFDNQILSATRAYAVGIGGAIVKYSCTTGGCDILLDGKLKEDGTFKLKEDGDNKILE